MMIRARPRKIGIALGSGSARGWAHIGVIRVLEREGISPDIVCGTSIGALVGAAYAAGELDRLEPWVKGLSRKDVVSLLDFKMIGGLIEGNKLMDFFRSHFDDQGIEKLSKPFGCVATELFTGREVWLREGPVVDAVRASIALPGLFLPAQHDDRLLVDGALVNPVPVSLCRAMGADIVIAVDLNRGQVVIRNHVASEGQEEQEESSVLPSGVNAWLDTVMAKIRPSFFKKYGDLPSMLDVLSMSLNIMQMRITQSRLAGEPADVVIRPYMPDVATMEYHLASKAIAHGERATKALMVQIKDALGE